MSAGIIAPCQRARLLERGIQVGLGGAIRNSIIQANQNTALNGDGGGILFDGPRFPEVRQYRSFISTAGFYCPAQL